MISPQRRGGGHGGAIDAALARLPFVLPPLAVAVVAFSVQIAGRPRAIVGVRVRGGPTDGASDVSVRLEVVERLDERERPLGGRPVTVEGGGAAGRAEWRGTLDDEGAAEVRLPSRARGNDGSARVRIRVSGVAVDARWQLSAEHWASHARRRGGWVERRFEGGVLRAAVERGVLAVPFPGVLWVEAERDGAFVSRIDATGDGAGVAGIAPSGHRLRYRVTPREHAISVTLRIPDLPEGFLAVSPAVVPGALVAELEGDAIVVRSPVVHERAYVAVVTERERIGGGTVILEPDGRGGSRGVLGGWQMPAREALWAVVSSEPELRSPSLVGWPIRYAEDGAPPLTFDVPDALLFDGVGDAVARELGRVRHVRAISALIAVVTLAVTAAAVAERAHRARVALTAHLENEGADAETRLAVAGTGGASVWLVVVAVLSIALAALLAALFVVAR